MAETEVIIVHRNLEKCFAFLLLLHLAEIALHKAFLYCTVFLWFFFFFVVELKLADSGREGSLCPVTVANPILKSLLKFVILLSK